MQIIWDQEVVEKIKNTHTILELETFEVEDKFITAYCVVPAEKIVMEIMQLDANKELHNGFVKAFKDKNYALCNELSEHLMGKFGGEVDTFYEEIINRINLVT
jgi:hypothetical protein